MLARFHSLFPGLTGRMPVLFLLISLVGFAAGPVLSSALPQPSGRIVLTVSGAIENTNTGDLARFDRQMLEDLGTRSLTTSTSWTDGPTRFEGVLARDLLRAVGAKGSVVKATALNDYSIEIPIEDFEKYPVLFAMKMDGSELSRRDKGPIWVVYPRDDYSELRNPKVDAKWIWQLVKIEVK